MQFQNLGLRYADSRTGTLIQILAASMLYWLMAPWFLHKAYWLTSAVVVFAVEGSSSSYLAIVLAL